MFDEAGNLVSTDEDPNRRLVDFGDLENGLTGDDRTATGTTTST